MTVLSDELQLEIQQRAHELSVQAYEIYRDALTRQVAERMEEGEADINVQDLDVPMVRFGFFNQ